MSPTLLGFRLVGAACLLSPALASGQPARAPRAEMDGFAAALDAAVRRVSRPSPAMMAGRERARGYRLPGLGALFVLPPRALPAPRPRPAESAAALSVDEAIRHLEQGLHTAAAPEVRQQMEKSLQALREMRTELRSPDRDRAATVMMLAPPDTTAEADAGELRLEQLRRELESQMAEQIRALQAAELSGGEQERERARRLEARVFELQARMEAVRREVEEARLAAERQLEMLVLPPAAAEAPGAPAAPAPATVTPTPGSAPARSPDAVIAAIPPPPAPPPAPWQFWFDTGDPGDGRTEEALIRDVKEAVTALVEKQGSSLRQLRPDEYVTVAVDFVPRLSILGRQVEKTLVVKVKKQDLDERRAGRLAAHELRRRVEYVEY